MITPRHACTNCCPGTGINPPRTPPPRPDHLQPRPSPDGYVPARCCLLQDARGRCPRAYDVGGRQRRDRGAKALCGPARAGRGRAGATRWRPDLPLGAGPSGRRAGASEPPRWPGRRRTADRQACFGVAHASRLAPPRPITASGRRGAAALLRRPASFGCGNAASECGGGERRCTRAGIAQPGRLGHLLRAPTPISTAPSNPLPSQHHFKCDAPGLGVGWSGRPVNTRLGSQSHAGNWLGNNRSAGHGWRQLHFCQLPA